jgi:hypothetical protein
MIDFMTLLGGFLVGLFRSHAAREAEMAFLRHQLLVLKRSAPPGLRFRTADRLLFVLASERVPSLLALEIPRSRRSAFDPDRDPRSDSDDQS